MPLTLFAKNAAKPLVNCFGKHHARQPDIRVPDRDQIGEITPRLRQRNWSRPSLGRSVFVGTSGVDEFAKLHRHFAVTTPRFAGGRL
jgi:hypothetical protein